MEVEVKWKWKLNGSGSWMEVLNMCEKSQCMGRGREFVLSAFCMKLYSDI